MTFIDSSDNVWCLTFNTVYIHIYIYNLIKIIKMFKLISRNLTYIRLYTNFSLKGNLTTSKNVIKKSYNLSGHIYISDI